MDPYFLFCYLILPNASTDTSAPPKPLADSDYLMVQFPLYVWYHWAEKCTVLDKLMNDCRWEFLFVKWEAWVANVIQAKTFLDSFAISYQLYR